MNRKFIEQYINDMRAFCLELNFVRGQLSL